jgi:hypothetical protein
MQNNAEFNFDEEEFRKVFPAGKTQGEIDKAKEWEEFLQTADFIQSVEQNIKQRREMPLLALTCLDINTRNGEIKSETTFGSLYKFFGNKALLLYETGKTTFNVEDKTVIYLFKALLELKQEGFNEMTTVEGVITALDEKYKSLQNIKS